ncbi:unnamed protein product [Brassica oleracea]
MASVLNVEEQEVEKVDGDGGVVKSLVFVENTARLLEYESGGVLVGPVAIENVP